MSGRVKKVEIRAAIMVEQQPAQGINVLEFPWPLNNAAVRVAGWQSLGFLPSESPFQVSMCVYFSLRPSELLAPHALEY